MNEVDKLRMRLKNVGKNVIEYRMTIAEAKNLLAEIDKISSIQQEQPQQVVLNEPAIITRTIDGGDF